MTKKEILETIDDEIQTQEALRTRRRENAVRCAQQALKDKDLDLAELDDILSDYHAALEAASLRALEQLLALKERIEGREE